ncbi:MAG: S8 family serine peptidase [Elusimicrobia bacterium]|nr:S8 family serine peptidase [Elusimicrobiota bacterium]
MNRISSLLLAASLLFSSIQPAFAASRQRRAGPGSSRGPAAGARRPARVQGPRTAQSIQAPALPASAVSASAERPDDPRRRQDPGPDDVDDGDGGGRRDPDIDEPVDPERDDGFLLNTLENVETSLAKLDRIFGENRIAARVAKLPTIDLARAGLHELLVARQGALLREIALERRLSIHHAHAIEDSGNAHTHHRKARETQQDITALKAHISSIEARIREVQEAILQQQPADSVAMPHSLEDAAQPARPRRFNIPVEDEPAQADLTPWEKALALGRRLHLKGFKIPPVEAGQPVRVIGSWTEKEVNYSAVGIQLALSQENGLVATRNGQTLTPEELMSWLEIAEMAGLKSAPAPFQIPEKDRAAAEAGKKLLSWRVPPHILNHSLQAVMGANKRRFTLSPDVVFYFFRQGVPLATPVGQILAQFLAALREEGRERALSQEELYSLGVEIEQEIPRYRPEEAQESAQDLYRRLADNTFYRPLVDSPVGIDLGRPGLDLAGYLRKQFDALRGKLNNALSQGADLETLQDPAQALRFAWTALAPLSNELRTMLHRDGFSFLKYGSAHEWEVWRMLPLGEAVFSLGLNDIIRRRAQRGGRGYAVPVIADSGVVDTIHPDNSKNVIDLDRAGREIPTEQLLAKALAAQAAKKKEEAKKGDLSPEAVARLAEGTETQWKKGGEDIQAHAHATAIATPLGLAAEVLGRKIRSVDLPNFQGDSDKVPEGDRENYFFDELKRSVEAAIQHILSEDELSIPVVNFSWGGSFDSRIGEWMNEVAAKYGAIFVAAFGNSGPGRHQETVPSYADAVDTIAATNGLNAEANFTSGGGLGIRTASGKRAERPTRAAPGGVWGANSFLQPGVQNADMGVIFAPETSGRYMHDRGTSFAAPLDAMALTFMADEAVFQALEFFKASGLSERESRARVKSLLPSLARQVSLAATAAAEMMIGVPRRYQGNGAIRPSRALESLTQRVREILESRTS